MPTCDICGEKVDKVYPCENCGMKFCKDCGDTDRMICEDCLEFEAISKESSEDEE